MNRNVNSPSKLTEFTPLSPEECQSGASIFSKIFNFNKTSNITKNETINSNSDEQNFSKDSKSCKQLKCEIKLDYENVNNLIRFTVDSREGRSLPNVLKRISNIVALKSNNLQSYKDSELRSYWMPDSVSKQCYECGERFTTFRRRHHCRVCGQIFCSKCCCDEIPGKIMGCTGDLRVCTYCCKVVLSYLQSSDIGSVLSADLKALQEDLEEKYGNNSAPKKCTNEIIENEKLIHRKPSVGYMEEKYAFGRSSHTYLTSQERTFALQNSTSLRMIYEELFRSNQAIILQTHRIRLNRYYNCFLGNELVNWIITQKKATTRIQATAIGQALFEAGFIESVLLDNTFCDSSALFKPAKLSQIQNKDILIESQISCDAQEPAWVKMIPQHDLTTDSENENKQAILAASHIPSANSSFYLDLNIEASTVTLKRPISENIITFSTNCNEKVIEQKEIMQYKKKNNSEDVLNDKLLVQEIKNREGWHQMRNLENDYNESSIYSSLSSVYKQHEDYLLRQLLNKEGLMQNWTEIIHQITHQIVDYISPDLYHNTDDIDIRQYVQIKKSPGGSKNDCEIVSGVVCSKNIAHKGMNAMIANPKILLLQCGLMYQRVEGKLLSLEPVMLQENEYLGHAVARITALGPDIVLVHRSVSRLAQDRLRECGVTLILNVKLSILERLARCTGANIIDSIDAHISTRYKLGTCNKFYLRNFPNETTRVRTLMYFEGCMNRHLGATVLLRGGSQIELSRVKKVTSMMIFAAYSNRLEKAFLVDEFAKPPSPKDNSFLDDSSRNISTNKIEETTKKQNYESICDKQEKLLEDNKDNTHQTNLENIFSRHRSALVKSNSNDNLNVEDFSGNENLNHIPSSLVKAIHSYDTLKLFKTKSKLYNNESRVNDEPNIPEILSMPIETNSLNDGLRDGGCTLELYSKSNNFDSSDSRSDKLKINNRDKSLIDDKRVHGESISDKSDPLHQYMNQDENDEFNRFSLNSQCLSVADLPLLNNFKKALEGTILSISPYMKFSIPYLETELGRNCVLRSFFPKELYYSTYFNDKIEGTKLNNSFGDMSSIENYTKNIKFKPEHPFIKAKLTMSTDSREVQNLLSDFRACGGRLSITNNETREKKIIHQNEVTEPIIWPDCLEPASHQGLSVLFCSFLHNNNTNNASTFCVNPWVVNMDLYGRNDIALGRFLERYCLTTEYKCPAQNCKAQIAQHVRRFAHDGGCVHISLCEMSADPFGNSGQDSSKQIFMWSKCGKCKSISPVVPISEDTWSLSFAKYLELRFHSGVYTRYDTKNSCQHSLHHDHLQYFSKRKMLAVMKYSKISLWEISLPPPLISVIYDPRMHTNLIEEIKGLTLKGDELYSNVREKIGELQDESLINAMKIQLAKEQQYFKNKIEELQLKLISSSLENKKFSNKLSDNYLRNLIYKIEDDQVILKRLIFDAVFNWSAKLTEATSKKKDDRQSRKQHERGQVLNNNSSNVCETADYDIYITEDVVPESHIEEVSPIIADYNAVDAIRSIQTESQVVKLAATENSINDLTEIPIIINPEEIIVFQGSPKILQKSLSDIIPSCLEEASDKKKKKKTILSQLLPTTTVVNIIPNPFGPLEHYLLQPVGSVLPIVIYEAEPSSIIAYALNSNDYKYALHERLRTVRNSESIPSPLNRRKFQENKENVSPVEVDKLLQPSEAILINNIIEIDEEKKVVKQQQNYIEVQFTDSTTNFYCRIYFAAQFADLRENVFPCGEEGYIRSLSHSIQWTARGGKSGSAFCKTKDDRFVLKEMTRMDMQIFLDFAPNYFAYMDKCQKNKQPTLLGKIVGIYRVSFKNNTTNAALRTSVLVMENLFYNKSITDKFDLKGSVRNRLVNPDDVDHEGELVLLDENLLNMSCDSPLYIRPHAKAVLNKAIEEDTKFLSDNCVMDYSLLVGLEPNSDQLVLGIIDYLRTFTWDKKIETMVKKSGILGGQGKLPTIVSPVEYRARFIAAMHKYFLPVPDRWTGLNRGVIVT